MARSLQKSLFRIINFSILLTTTLILIAIWNITSSQVNRQLNKDLSVAQAVLTQVSKNRQDQLVNSATILTSEFAFKKAMATGDIPTIQSALNNHGKRIEADLMLLIDLQGNIITHYPEINLNSSVYPNSELNSLLLQNGSLKEISVIEDKLFQIILLPIKAPSMVGIAGVAFEYDKATLNELKQIVSGEIIITRYQNNEETILASTLESEHIKAVGMFSSPTKWITALLESKPIYYTRNIKLPAVNHSQVNIQLAQNITPVYTEMFSTLMVLIGICALVMIITATISMGFSRSINKPVLTLVNLANRIAKGNYDDGQGFKAKLIELEELAKALFKMRENIKTRESEITFNAHHDLLTSLHNRFYFEKALNSAFETREKFQIIGLSLKELNNVNNLYGYVNCNECLVQLANRIKHIDGLKCRITGGKFCILMDKPFCLQELQQLKSKLEASIKFETFNVQIKVVVSVIDIFTHDDSVEGVFRKLNIALEGSKTSKASIVFYDPEQEKQYLRRLEIITELKQTLQSNDNQLFLVYQPKLDLKSGKVTAAEALIRWINPKLGFVPPDEFIGIAEQANLIESVTTFVMKQAVDDMLLFKNSGVNINLALNLSTQDIENYELLTFFKLLIKKHNIAAHNFQLEVTESDIVRDASSAIDHLKELQKDGFSIAIDDFGTGYSSLAYLKNLPVNTLKIDRCFVMNLSNDSGDQTLVKSVLQLANSFRLSVVAEGIEDKQALDILKDWGCDYAQGYFIAKPLAKEKMIEFLEKRKEVGIQ